MHPLKVNTIMRRGQNSNLRDQIVPAFKVRATTQKAEDDREEVEHQVAYATNAELRSEGKALLKVEVDDPRASRQSWSRLRL
jgi:ribosomal protein L17